MKENIWSYLRRDKKTVDGWLQRVDAEIIGSILSFQFTTGVSGGLAEIGVHHGKSFIALCMALQDNERALCIDVFDDQKKNLDSSGKGDFQMFSSNLDRFDIDSSRVCIHKGSSDEVNYEYIQEKIGQVRLFSIDGGHWKSIVLNDLRLAENTLSDEGVIALDDFFRADWPEVTSGYFLWQEETESDIIPFAIGSNKLYLCRKNFAQSYQSALRTDFLSHFFVKKCEFESHFVDSYRAELGQQDESPFNRIMALMLRIFQPDLFVALKSRYSALRKHM